MSLDFLDLALFGMNPSEVQFLETVDAVQLALDFAYKALVRTIRYTMRTEVDADRSKV